MYMYMYVCMYLRIYMCMYNMLALRLPLTIIKFETMICLLTRVEENNLKSKNRTKKPKDLVGFF